MNGLQIIMTEQYPINNPPTFLLDIKSRGKDLNIPLSSSQATAFSEKVRDKQGKLGILGGRGMLGSDLAYFLKDYYEISVIDVDNYEKEKGSSYDIFINADGNSKRFWANANPLEDFKTSTISVYNSLFDFSFNKYVYVSSVDVYPDYSDPQKTYEDIAIDSSKLSSYGLHKYLSEQIVKKYSTDYIIMRSALILGQILKKGPFYDILCNKPLFITLDSKIQVIPTYEFANILRECLERGVSKEIFNIGGKGYYDFQNAERDFGRHPQIFPEAQKQHYEVSVSKINSIYQLKSSEEYVKAYIEQKNSK